MSLTIDTSVLIRIEKGDKKIMESIKKARETYPSPPSVTFIAYFEFLQGIRERNPKNKDKAVKFIELFRFLSLTKSAANILNDLKHKYEKLGKSFTLSDLLIASQAIENDLTLVTADKQFQEIEELKKIVL